MHESRYHAPPDELAEKTRAFARMLTSPTEQAEAIGWYEQRIGVGQDDSARSSMENAQQEEFKHLAVDLEFLLRRTPKWRAACQGVLFRDGDIVELGEKAEKAEDDV